VVLRSEKSMGKIFRLFSEKNYKEIVKEIGINRYGIFQEGDVVPGDILKEPLPFKNYNCVVAGTGTTLEFCVINTNYENQIEIPENSQVIDVRLLRFDDKHGEPHYNADDLIIFPTSSGDILKLHRKDAPDHYIEIAKAAGIQGLADAYKLPRDKSGETSGYHERGAHLHFPLIPITKRK
jgi:hypothetical protein